MPVGLMAQGKDGSLDGAASDPLPRPEALSP